MVYLTNNYVLKNDDWFLRLVYYQRDSFAAVENNGNVEFSFFESDMSIQMFANAAGVSYNKAAAFLRNRDDFCCVPKEYNQYIFLELGVIEKIIRDAEKYSDRVVSRNKICKVALYMLISISSAPNNI